MSLSAKSVTKTRSAIRDRYIQAEAINEIKSFLKGCLEYPYWELSQDEADEIAAAYKEAWNSGRRYSDRQEEFEGFIEALKKKGKSAGAIYLAARIHSGAEPDLRQLTQDWFAHRNIRRSLSEDELREIGASPMNLRMLGITGQREAREFYSLYKEVMDKNRVWGSSCQVNQAKVKAIALTPNYNRLPLWVKKAMLSSGQWIESGENARIGNIWRLIDCAKAWKHAPHLPKGIAEKVGRMSPKSRMLADWAWLRAVSKMNVYSGTTFRDLHQSGWEQYGEPVNRAELVQTFWIELKRLQSASLPALIAERHLDDGYWASGFNPEDHNRLRGLSETILGLPHGYLFEDWGRHKYASEQKYLGAIATHGSPEQVCLNLFGSAGKATVKAFQSSTQTAWRWASELCDRNPDAAQKIMGMTEMIEFEPDAIEFLKSLPMQSRIRLLGATTFKYRGVVNPISPDHVRDTGYLWKNIQQVPDLGRVRCWFSVHENLAAAFVKELPDEALPIPTGWKQVDGLCAVDGSWSLEFPKRVATLKYYGEVLRNCVGGYGPAIKSGRSVIFVVREQGLMTHCVEVSKGYVNQFYRSGNSSPDYEVKDSVCEALRQARLID